MARVFTGSNVNYLSAAGAVGSPFPLTMAIWGTLTSGGVARGVMSLNNGTTGHMLGMSITTTNILQIQTNGGGSIATVNATTGVPIDGTWFHACAVFTAVNSRKIFFNGGNSATQSNTRSPTGLNNFTIGRRVTVSYIGRLAWGSIWDASLTDGEVYSLSRGVCPLFIRPASLVAVWPIFGRNSPEIDIIGKNDLTVNGTLTHGSQVKVSSWIK